MLWGRHVGTSSVRDEEAGWIEGGAEPEVVKWGLWLLLQGPLKLRWSLEVVPNEDQGAQAFVLPHRPVIGGAGEKEA